MNGFRRFTKPCLPLVAVLALGVGPPVYAVHDLELFELDTRAGVEGDQDKKNNPIPALVGGANTVDNAAPGDDWANVYQGTSSAFVTSFIEDTFANGNINNGAQAFVAARTPEVTFFTGGGSKDTNGIQDGPWLYDTVNDVVPDKNDIVNAFAAAYENPANDHVIFYFGLDTLSVNGSANAGFWFFRNDVTLTPLAPGSNTGTFTGEHADGDIFVAVAYSEGGRVGDIDVFVWQGDDATGSLVQILESQSCADPTLTNDDVCGVINRLLPGTTFGEDPIFNYANTLVANNPTSATSYQYQSAALVEFGLDITALFLEYAGNGDIGCFSSFLAETRSSQSTTAQLKDLALGEFSLCGVSVTKACDGDAVLASDGSDVTVNWKGTVTSTGAGAIDVVVEDINDSGVASVFDAACIDGDTGTPNGQCGDADDTAVVFTDNGDGTVNIALNGSESVLIEGHYVVTVPADPVGAGFDLSFDDYLVATAYEPGTSDEVDSSTSGTATCDAPDNPDISVDKTCSASYTNGDTFTADVQFVVTNTGNVLLDTFSVSDASSEGANTEADFNYCIDNAAGEAVGPTGAGCDVGTTLAAATLAIGEKLVGYDSYVHDSDGVTSHTDTVTVSALSAFTDQSTGDVLDSTGGTGEACAIQPNPEVEVVKVCDSSLGGGSGVDLVMQGGVLVVRVGAVITADNTGNEDLNVQISDSKVSNLNIDSISNGSVVSGCDGTTDTCVLFLEAADGEGTSAGTATITGDYFPADADSGTIGVPSGVGFSNLITLDAEGVLTGSDAATTVNTDLDVTCELCD